MAMGGDSGADTQAIGVVFALPGASVMYGLPLSAVRSQGEVSGMAKYKRHEWSLISQQREKHAKPPRHGHVVLRGASACGDCGDRFPWSHLVAYGGVCRWCWEAWQVSVGVLVDG